MADPIISEFNLCRDDNFQVMRFLSLSDNGLVKSSVNEVTITNELDMS